jgi:hypothetical protein
MRAGVIRLSWACVAVMVLAVTSCAPVHGELTPRQTTVPAAPFGLVVGVVAVARTPGTPPSAAGAVNVYMAYKQSDGVPGELELATASGSRGRGVFHGVEDGLTVSYRPFVLKLPAGRSEFVSFATRRVKSEDRREEKLVSESYKDQQGKWHTTSEAKTVTVTDYIAIVSGKDLPANRFEVAAGKVRYVGRVGMVVHADRPGTCEFGILEPFSDQCVARKPFMENEEAADLTMIRRHFPNLAGVEIESRPLEVAPGSWQTLRDAARQYGGGQ